MTSCSQFSRLKFHVPFSSPIRATYLAISSVLVHYIIPITKHKPATPRHSVFSILLSLPPLVQILSSLPSSQISWILTSEETPKFTSVKKNSYVDAVFYVFISKSASIAFRHVRGSWNKSLTVRQYGVRHVDCCLCVCPYLMVAAIMKILRRTNTDVSEKPASSSYHGRRSGDEGTGFFRDAGVCLPDCTCCPQQESICVTSECSEGKIKQLSAYPVWCPLKTCVPSSTTAYLKLKFVYLLCTVWMNKNDVSDFMWYLSGSDFPVNTAHKHLLLT